MSKCQWQPAAGPGAVQPALNPQLSNVAKGQRWCWWVELRWFVLAKKQAGQATAVSTFLFGGGGVLTILSHPLSKGKDSDPGENPTGVAGAATAYCSAAALAPGWCVFAGCHFQDAVCRI
jgi:hypothetical protein